MASGHRGHGQTAYRPTSLDFINLPNPIEPSAESQKHFLNGTAPLEKAKFQAHPNQNRFKYIRDSSTHNLQESSGGSVLSNNTSEERPTKFQKPNNDLFLPKLPVRNAAKRLRIPPTLSGLHYPPPDAGLLPSINTNQPQHPPPRQQCVTPPLAESRLTQINLPATDSSPSSIRPDACTNEAGSVPKAAHSKRTRRRKWSEEETEDLLKGVARFGIGNWTRILKCPDLTFDSRTALDLKDRFRVCCPDQYKSKAESPRAAKASAETHKSPQVPNCMSDALARIVAAPSMVPDNSTSTSDVSSAKSGTKGPIPERIPQSKLDSLGIDQPFAKTTRRPRHGYTAVEDEALLRGFRMYGNSWSSIREDSNLGLGARRATDLRDRFRTKFPDEYKNAGLAPRPSTSGAGSSDAKVQVSNDSSASRSHTQSNLLVKSVIERSEHEQNLLDISSRCVGNENTQSQDNADAPTNQNPIRKSALPLPLSFSFDDDFLDIPLNSSSDILNTGITSADQEASEPIILDRGILDWASSGGGGLPNAVMNDMGNERSLIQRPLAAPPPGTAKSSATIDNMLNGSPSTYNDVQQSNTSNNSNLGGIDPLITLKLPTMTSFPPPATGSQAWFSKITAASSGALS